MKGPLLLIGLLAIASNLLSQNQTPTVTPTHSEVKQALEVESLVPMFFSGGYHVGVGYRYERFRVRASIINGGSYNAEKAGINNNSSEFKRFYKTSPGIFFGYNVWKNLEVYTYAEFHTFTIQQKSTKYEKDLYSTDFGGGIGYQFFIGRYFYIQPALHIYLRKDKSLDFDGTKYNIPNTDFSPVIRLGVRLWSK
ncbi:hypothetical protein [Dysgonomonas macrotermitis]|uniref:Outer membrane protein beta-barrel domain-containing protein n=1 Tax=Dysgonomonas macrotermitis TaxID=1346286 RepID=A0A1M5ET41_9BACT|nr:hypothetical protein [Dysgonomonas macrotermitis]SHF82301.1 hypothetical protein SAMN05444362_110134 [Dysgonomonas macrotermitis]